MVFVYASFLIGLAKLLCVFIHEIPDQVRDDGFFERLRMAVLKKSIDSRD